MSNPLPANRMDTVGTRWRYSKGGLHAAFDFKVSDGTPVFAVSDGKVLACNDGVANVARPGVVGAASNWVLLGITHKGRPVSVYYQHLSPGLAVRTGQQVKAGDKLGESGRSGNATGPHLHLATMWGHRKRSTRYAYMIAIRDSEDAPGDGTASNDICIFPPSLVYSARGGAAPSNPWASGRVLVSKLRFGTNDSDSVRRLQHRLNQIKLKDGRELAITGDYGLATKAEATKWQIQKDGAEPGSPAADGNIGPKQARKLFTARYTVKP